MKIETLKNGALKLSIDSNADREIIEDRGDRTDFDVLNDLLEPYWTNGKYVLFDAGLANPCVGITDAPCIAEEMDFDEDGKRVITGWAWYFDGYATKDMIDTLASEGEIVFRLIPPPTQEMIPVPAVDVTPSRRPSF